MNRDIRDLALLNFAKGFREGLLMDKPSNWMCRAVCMPLQTLLGMSGYETQITEGTVIADEAEIEHTWLTLDDGRVLDPTADQFNEYISELDMPPVFLGPLPSFYLPKDG